MLIHSAHHHCRLLTRAYAQCCGGQRARVGRVDRGILDPDAGFGQCQHAHIGDRAEQRHFALAIHPCHRTGLSLPQNHEPCASIRIAAVQMCDNRRFAQCPSIRLHTDLAVGQRHEVWLEEIWFCLSHRCIRSLFFVGLSLVGRLQYTKGNYSGGMSDAGVRGLRPRRIFFFAPFGRLCRPNGAKRAVS